MVVYKNGEYFQTRNVRFNLKYICDKFSELTGNRVDENDFYAMLKKDGINFENPMERDSLIDIFNDIFIYIGDIINSISKVYKTQIKNVFIGSDIGSINGVEIFVEDRLALTYKSFDFDIAVNTKDFEITQLDMLMMLAAQSYLAEPDDEFNFSTFLRPPPFMKRDSGKLFAAVGAGILIGVSMPIYWYGFGYFNLLQTEKKEVELSAATNEKNRIERALSNLDNEIKAVMKKSDGQKAILDDKN